MLLAPARTRAQSVKAGIGHIPHTLLEISPYVTR